MTFDWILSHTNRKFTTNNYCIQLLLFPTLFNDINIHTKDGHIRKPTRQTSDNKQSTINNYL